MVWNHLTQLVKIIVHSKMNSMPAGDCTTARLVPRIVQKYNPSGYASNHSKTTSNLMHMRKSLNIIILLLFRAVSLHDIRGYKMVIPSMSCDLTSPNPNPWKSSHTMLVGILVCIKRTTHFHSHYSEWVLVPGYLEWQGCIQK